MFYWETFDVGFVFASTNDFKQNKYLVIKYPAYSPPICLELTVLPALISKHVYFFGGRRQQACIWMVIVAVLLCICITLCFGEIKYQSINRTQDNSYPRQLVTRSTSNQDDSYSRRLVPRRLVPKTTRTPHGASGYENSQTSLDLMASKYNDHWLQLQKLSGSVSQNHTHTYIFVGLIFMLWHRETHITHKGIDKFS